MTWTAQLAIGTTPCANCTPWCAPCAVDHPPGAAVADCAEIGNDQCAATPARRVIGAKLGLLQAGEEEHAKANQARADRRGAQGVHTSNPTAGRPSAVHRPLCPRDSH